MWIERLRLKNFRCFEDREIEFRPGFNVLIGENGAGKTSVVEAVAIALSDYIVNVTPWEERESHCHQIELHQVRRLVSCNGQVFAEEAVYPSSVECETSGVVRRLGAARESAALEGFHSLRGQGRPRSSPDAELRNFGRDRDLPLLAVFQADRTMPAPDKGRIFDMKVPSRGDGYVGWAEQITDSTRILRWFAQREGAELQTRVEPPDLAAVRAAVQAGMEDYRRVQFDFPHGTLYATAEAGHSFPFHELSAGFRRIFAMVADIAQRATLLNPQLGADAVLQTPGVVLIDEIDLHLHPKWQRKIVDALKLAFPKIQFIATTHSPFIIQSLRPGELIKLDGDLPDVSYSGQSILDVAIDQMDVPELPSWRLERMWERTERYQALLDEGRGADDETVVRVKAELDKLTLMFAADDASVALQAFLARKREVAGLGNGA